jgi:hypothetical protein
VTRASPLSQVPLLPEHRANLEQVRSTNASSSSKPYRPYPRFSPSSSREERHSGKSSRGVPQSPQSFQLHTTSPLIPPSRLIISLRVLQHPRFPPRILTVHVVQQPSFQSPPVLRIPTLLRLFFLTLQLCLQTFLLRLPNTMTFLWAMSLYPKPTRTP